MRYDLELTVNLKENAPDSVVRFIAFLMGEGELPPPDVPEHPFGADLSIHRFADWATSCEPHAGDAICSFRRVYRYTHRGIDHYQHTLHLRFCEKAEGIFEVTLPFAMWLAKWSEQNEFVGYFKASDERYPTLLYIHEEELYLRAASEPPQRATDGNLWT